jgi:heme a synthase
MLEQKINRVKKFSLILSIFIFINILFGPLVRATDSGLACPDWPLCFGKVLPPPEFRIWMEVGHRFYSMFLGFFILGLFIFIMKDLELRKRFGLLSTVSILVLILQVFLGKLTVTLMLNPATVNSHLLNAILLFAIIITIFHKSSLLVENPNQISVFPFQSILKKENLFLGLLLIIVYYQLLAGGRVSSNYAGLACSDFPTCNGQLFPKMEGLVRIQMEHRIFAYLISILVIIQFAISIFKNYSKKLKIYFRMSLYVLGLQIILGISNVIFKLPVLVTAMHTGMGVLLFILIYSSYYRKLSEEANP